MLSSPEFYLTLALRCREVAAMITRDDLKERLEKIIADLESQALLSLDQQLADARPTDLREPARK